LVKKNVLVQSNPVFKKDRISSKVSMWNGHEIEGINIALLVCNAVFWVVFIYLFIVYLRTLFHKRGLYGVEWKDMWMMNWKRCRRKLSWPNLRHPGICLEGLRKATKKSVRIAGLRAEIWTWKSWIQGRSVNHSTTMFSLSECE
jgi:hypothetical protein